ncbi:MAG: hypothetical protein H6672_22010 [Anaerolineaceae bacterium]|nr:hypothetical protein [Anaerolineaceae bacterium]
MGQIHQLDFQVTATDMQLAGIFDTLDDLHSAASDGTLPAITGLSNRELIGWLHELVYTAQETISEIEQHNGSPNPVLRLVK